MMLIIIYTVSSNHYHYRRHHRYSFFFWAHFRIAAAHETKISLPIHFLTEYSHAQISFHSFCFVVKVG